jgi:hypothetical protein
MYSSAFCNVGLQVYILKPPNFSLDEVQWPAKKTSHHLNVSVKKALITPLDFDVKVSKLFFRSHYFGTLCIKSRDESVACLHKNKIKSALKIISMLSLAKRQTTQC